MQKRMIALLLVLCCVLSACGMSGTQETTAPSNPETTAPSTPAQTTPATEPPVEINNETVDYYMSKANEVVVTDTHVIFTDDTGRGELQIEKNLENVSVLYSSLACLWYEAGGEACQLIGGKSAIELYVEQIGRDITLDEGVRVVSDSVSGKNWDVESILADKPSLIICSMSISGYKTIGEAATTAGIPVIGIQYDTVQDYLKWFKVFCNLSGHPELWESVANVTAQKVIDVVSKIPADVPAPRVITLRINGGVLEAYGNGSQIGSLVKELGGINVIETDPVNGMTDSVEINMEDIYALDPDIILLPERGEPGAEWAIFEETYGEDPVWNALRAVQGERVYILERGLYHQKPNWRYQEAYINLAENLYPEYDFG